MTRDAESGIASTPNHPKRSISAPRANWAAIRTAVVATIPIRGPATVIERMMTAPITPPSSIHLGPSTPRARPSSERRVARSTVSATRPPMTEAHARASIVPIRSLSRPWTAICTAPARPAIIARTVASEVELTRGRLSSGPVAR